MANNSRRRNILIALAVLLIAIILLLLFTRCQPPKPTPTAQPPAPTPASPRAAAPATPTPATAEPAEVLTPATLTAPDRITAGAAFSVAWTGPDNRGDYITIVAPQSPATASGNYRQTEHGKSLELTAPLAPGAHEVRYVTARSHTILARAPIEVVPAGVTLTAAAEVTLGSSFPVTWTGPDNKGDYITVVAKDAPDDHYGNYTTTDKGSPLTVTAPTTDGNAEIRYVAADGRKVLARRPIKVVAAAISLSAPADAVAGSTIEITWTGPNNAGDYITVVEKEKPDGQYGHYTTTSQGSPLKLLTPIMAGGAELRYMTGQGGKVLARRPINIAAAKITLSAPPESAAGAPVSITWTGPNNPGDYITIVPKTTPDGQYGDYTNTSTGSPLNVKAPKQVGDAEIRYASSQGNKVLARIPIKIVP